MINYKIKTDGVGFSAFQFFFLSTNVLICFSIRYNIIPCDIILSIYISALNQFFLYIAQPWHWVIFQWRPKDCQSITNTPQTNSVCWEPYHPFEVVLRKQEISYSPCSKDKNKNREMKWNIKKDIIYGNFQRYTPGFSSPCFIGTSSSHRGILVHSL